MIGIKNINFRKEGMKRHDVVRFQNFSTTLAFPVWIAPVACVLERIDLVSTTAFTNTSTAVLGEITVFKQTATTSLLANLSGTGNVVSANSRFRITPSANNSLTQGTIIGIGFNLTGTTNISQAILDFTYSPLKHRENE